MSGLVANKIALVTGSSSGIGRGIAKVLAREGADVVVHCNSSLAGANATAEWIRRAGRKAHIVQADLRVTSEVDKLFRQALETFGRIDILVNNAGITTRRPFLETDENFLDEMLATDVKGVFSCARRAAAVMKEQKWGRIINISSLHDMLTSHEFSIYAAAKGAVSRLTAGMAIDLADYGITVNAISPGWVPVENEGVYPKKLFDGFCAHTPVGRPGTPEEVGELAAFLASDRAAWLTGQVIHLDGGMSCMINMPSRRRDREIYEPEKG